MINMLCLNKPENQLNKMQVYKKKMVYRAPNYQCSNSCYFLLFVTLFLKITSVLHETFLNVLGERYGEFAVIEDFRVINSFTRHSF